jgi:hypothetical protein
VLSLYLTFVLQTVWNWFAAPALHFDSISYWNMYGLLLITTLVRLRNSDVQEAQHILKVTTMVEACLPEARRAETMRLLEEGTVAKMLRPAVINGMRVLGAPAWLVIGFMVHTFLCNTVPNLI